MAEPYDFMDVSVADAEGLQILPENEEVKLIVTEATPNDEKAYCLLNLEVVGQDLVKGIRHFLFYTKTKKWCNAMGLDTDQVDAPKKAQSKDFRLRQFLEAFGLPTEGCSAQAMVGAEGWAILGVEESAEYGDQNKIKKLVNPAG